MRPSRRRPRLVRILLLAGAALLSACGPYTLQGRAVRGAYSGIMLVSPDDPRLNDPGVPGVGVSVIRDPAKPNRAQVASANSSADGDIKLPIDVFGVGITEEEWLISAGRGASGRLQTQLALPANAKSVRLLVMMTKAELSSGARGADGTRAEEQPYQPTFDDQVKSDLKKYGW
ncbi:MAG: hypothetical protein U0575_14785 [Phycisphaerales bacterium]